MYIRDVTELESRGRGEALAKLKSEYEKYRAMNLNLDIQRGKPCAEQLEFAVEMLDWGGAPYLCKDGIDARNYGGGIEGTPDARDLFAEIFGVERKNVIAWGNSSLNIMHDLIIKAMLSGVYGGAKPWLDQSAKTGKRLKFICPVPGYDRHFLITQTLGFEMINVKMRADGPDMDEIERIACNDEMVKGIWNIPKYNNPTGVTYSDETVRRFAAMKPKADDFRIFWDNSYIVHDLYDESDTLLNLLSEAAKYGNEDNVYMFTSTSKITFAGGGITAFVASENNIKHTAKQLSVQTICPDKLNQLRHVRYIKDSANLKAIMQRHASLIRPKFELVNAILAEEFYGLDRRDASAGISGKSGGANAGAGVYGISGGVDAGAGISGKSEGADIGGKAAVAAITRGPADICEWTNPRGGYFFSLDAPSGCAREALRLAAEAGVKFTPAGATFPYGVDPDDSNIRIAPTVPSLDELNDAIRVLALCIKIAYLSKE